ncbi:hypothetical protein BDY21DRAFT_408536 [Lineolata rhizophorae]|uniref:Uncharacterized protein n=1 Tax=Lineolata rhizophorae TaxID=578093 RepID=A0A6A6P657_9PEZI|nr:hypothetical protein BDY21DRAFT_408536 [Lineolata rhizophorae]
MMGTREQGHPGRGTAVSFPPARIAIHGAWDEQQLDSTTTATQRPSRATMTAMDAVCSRPTQCTEIRRRDAAGAERSAQRGTQSAARRDVVEQLGPAAAVPAHIAGRGTPLLARRLLPVRRPGARRSSAGAAGRQGGPPARLWLTGGAFGEPAGSSSRRPARPKQPVDRNSPDEGRPLPSWTRPRPAAPLQGCGGGKKRRAGVHRMRAGAAPGAPSGLPGLEGVGVCRRSTSRVAAHGRTNPHHRLFAVQQRSPRAGGCVAVAGLRCCRRLCGRRREPRTPRGGSADLLPQCCDGPAPTASSPQPKRPETYEKANPEPSSSLEQAERESALTSARSRASYPRP